MQLCILQEFVTDRSTEVMLQQIQSHPILKLICQYHFLTTLLKNSQYSNSNCNCTAYNALSIELSIMVEEYASYSTSSSRGSVKPINESKKSQSFKKSFDHLKNVSNRRIDGDPTESYSESLNDKNSKQNCIKIYRVDKKWKRDLQNFCQLYEEDMPDPQIISHEIDNWESLWLNYPKDQLPITLSETIKIVNSVSLQILATLPITSCACERAASSIHLLKSFLRSTMTQRRLSGLASLYTHKDIDVPVDKVIDRFSQNPRRMTLVNILDTDKFLPENDKAICSEIY